MTDARRHIFLAHHAAHASVHAAEYATKHALARKPAASGPEPAIQRLRGSDEGTVLHLCTSGLWDAPDRIVEAWNVMHQAAKAARVQILMVDHDAGPSILR